MSDFVKGLRQQIEALWAEAGVWPDLVEVMRLGLISQPSSTAGTERDMSRLARLPGLCCQASGGEPQWADRLTIAWLLFYAAADLMDSVQDYELSDQWVQEGGTAAALNAATGLYFSASWALNDLNNYGCAQQAARDIKYMFNKNLLLMSSGQQSELTHPEPTLDHYWQIVGAKSGAFFKLACRSGARLVCNDDLRLESFARFGNHLGLVIQLLDDLDEVRSPELEGVPGQRSDLVRSLPAIFALEVTSPVKQERLRMCLRDAPHHPAAAEEALSIIDASGASTYILAETERHKTLALGALESANPSYPAGIELKQLIHNL